MAEPRFDTDIAASFQVDEEKVAGRIENASLGGVFVETPVIPERGEKLWLSFEGPGGEVVEAIGIVWWTTHEGDSARSSRQGFGVRLVASSGDYRRFLANLSRRSGRPDRPH
jgi:hypothetical protein